MKKWLALLSVAVLIKTPSAGTDIGKLQPVQVVCLARAGDGVTVWTDTGDRGTGSNLKMAVEDMQSHAAGEIFLETADHLLLTRDCLELLGDASSLLRPSCTICLLEGEPNMEQLGQFFALHAPMVTLMEYRAGWGQPQTLKTIDGRMTLVS